MQIHTCRQLYTIALVIGSATIVAPSSAETHADSPRSLDDLLTSQDSVYSVQTSQGAVTLDVQPRWENGTLLVDIRASTHSVPLDSMDLTVQVRLIIGPDSIAPDKAGELSGHHGSTTLEFRLDGRPAEFTIEIRDIPDVPLRTLTWPAEAKAQPGSDNLRLTSELDRG